MSSSVEIIRDENGYFHHPSGYPLVVIFDSKHAADKTPDKISWQEPVVGAWTHRPKEDSILSRSQKTEAGTKPPNSGNIFRPVVYDRETEKLTRTHVIQDRQKRKREQKISILLALRLHTFGKTAKSFSLTQLLAIDLSIISNEATPSDLGCGKEIAVESWLPLAMTDAALFHSILCGAALHMELHTGMSESLQKLKHMKEAVNLLSARLQDPESGLSDGTIVTVAHLAEFERITGNFANWNLHMDGLYDMVRIRGGFAALDDRLKNKIWRADISGCIATLSKPRFTAIDVLSLSWLPLMPKEPGSTLCEGLRSIIETFTVDGDLIDILGDLQHLNSVLNDSKMDLLLVDRVIAPIQRNLLSFQFAGYEVSQNATLQELCCIGALIYLKTIYDFHHCLQLGKFPAGAIAGGAMVQKLKSCLHMADTNTEPNKSLFLWMMFLGGSAVAGTKDRTWFVARLVKTSMELQIYSWEDAKSSLMKFLWVDRIHENSCKELWDEAFVTLSVLF